MQINSICDITKREKKKFDQVAFQNNYNYDVWKPANKAMGKPYTMYTFVSFNPSKPVVPALANKVFFCHYHFIFLGCSSSDI